MISEGKVSDVLNIPGVTTLRHVASNNQNTFESRSLYPNADSCCLLWRAERFNNGFKRQQFVDTPREGRPAIIHHKRRRWGCKSCGKTTYEILEWADVSRGMTLRLGEYILEQATKRSFSQVGNDVGLDPKTVAAVFIDRAIPAVQEIRRITPRVLGLDEKHIFNGFRAVMGNVEKRTMYWMLPARNYDSLAEFFGKIRDRDKVEVVTIDMYAGYRKIIREFFPQAVIVVDKFHISRYATMAMDRARASLRKTQTQSERVRMMHQRFTLLMRRANWKDRHVATFHRIAAKYPDLAECYRWKERACQIFEQPTRREAEALYLQWRADLPDRFRIFFKAFISAMTNWGPEIFNYFDHRYTNAYVEALNGMVADANRIGRGYSYRALFLKTMLLHGKPKPRPRRVLRSAELLDGVVLPDYRDMGHQSLSADEATDDHVGVPSATLGADLSTLGASFRDPSVW